MRPYKFRLCPIWEHVTVWSCNILAQNSRACLPVWKSGKSWFGAKVWNWLVSLQWLFAKTLMLSPLHNIRVNWGHSIFYFYSFYDKTDTRHLNKYIESQVIVELWRFNHTGCKMRLDAPPCCYYTSSQLAPSAWVYPKTNVPVKYDFDLADINLDMFVSLCGYWITKPSRKWSPSKGNQNRPK